MEKYLTQIDCKEALNRFQDYSHLNSNKPPFRIFATCSTNGVKIKYSFGFPSKTHHTRTSVEVGLKKDNCFGLPLYYKLLVSQVPTHMRNLRKFSKQTIDLKRLSYRIVLLHQNYSKGNDATFPLIGIFNFD